MIWYNKDKTMMVNFDNIWTWRFVKSYRCVDTTYPDQIFVNEKISITEDVELLLELLKNKLSDTPMEQKKINKRGADNGVCRSNPGPL